MEIVSVSSRAGSGWGLGRVGDGSGSHGGLTPCQVGPGRVETSCPIHPKHDDWGEYEAHKSVIKMLCFQWCHLNGKSIDAVPIKDFIQAVDVEEFARI